MGDRNHIAEVLEVLMDRFGIRELLHTLVAVCWRRAAIAMEEGRDPNQWSELAVKLETVIEG
jgi:hypothetical protein